MICENCNKEHNGIFGSGRFCSKECAKSFSTKEKRKEINKKISKKPLEKNCVICKNIFYTKDPRKKSCSKKCRIILASQSNLGKKHNIIKDTSKMGGFRINGGKSKQYNYINWLNYKMSLNKEEIEVAKVLDEKKLNWNRNTKGFLYTTLEGKSKKFYPDFVINGKKYIEYKGWVTEEMIWKMKDAKEKNNLDLTIIYSESKRYKNLGLTLKEFKECLD